MQLGMQQGILMKTARNLAFLLCSAAGLTAINGARAADLPIKAKALEYVRVCSLYGAGFFYIPGTDACIKFGGYLRVDTTFNGGPQGEPAWNGDLGQHNRYADYFTTRSRMAFSVDTVPRPNTVWCGPSAKPICSSARWPAARPTRSA